MNSGNWRAWREHFERRKERPLPLLVRPYGLPQEWSEALIFSLARFQVGEGGEGRIAREIDGAMIPTIDADYRAALKLFVLEEGRHSAILAGMVRALGGRLLEETWTNRLFRRSRRMLGINFKLLVLLAAEVIGVGFYAVIKERLPAGSFRAALKEIVDDEASHLAFHAEYFRRLLTSETRRAAFFAAWWAIGLAACAVVLLDHRSTLRAFGLPLKPCALRLLTLLRQSSAAILGDRPLLPALPAAWGWGRA